MGDLVIANVMSWFDGNGALTPVPETPVANRAKQVAKVLD
jgi:hypothetical protein